MKKFLKMLRNNAGLKLLAFIFAVGLWLYVLNVEDPEITRSFTVEVTIADEDTLSEESKSYEVLNDSDTIRVTVSAQRSVIEELSSSDFSAVAYLSDLSTSEMEGEQELEVYVTMNRYSGKTTIISDTKYVAISIEEELTKSIEIEVNTSGTPASGYAVGSAKALPSTVTLTGVTSVVEKVETATAAVDISGMSADLSETATLIFYDADGIQVDVSDLTIDYPSVSVYVDCDEVKTVALSFSESGTPAEGYMVSQITADITEITVQGESDALEGVETIRISGDALDVSDASETITVEIDPADYLSYGLSMYDEDVTVTVTIEILEYESVTLSVDTADVVIEGLEDGLTASFESETVSVTLLVPTDQADSITADSVTLTADLTDRSEGTYYIILRSELPDLAYVGSTIGTTIIISGE